MKDILSKKLRLAISELVKEEISPIVTYTTDEKHGDYTTNVSFSLAKKLKESPLSIAQRLTNNLKIDGIEKIEAVSPGFINFTLAKNQLITLAMELINDKDKVAETRKMEGNIIVVEFTDPNPFKEFHIGHLYSNIVGESLCRLLETQGARVKRVCYQGDVGLHVAKSVWGMKKMEKDMPKEDANLDEKAKFMGKSYAYGSIQYEESEEAKKEIIEINKKIYHKDASLISLYITGREWSLAYFKKIYARLGTRFVRFYFESEISEKAITLVKENISTGIFEESEGAIIFRGENFGLHTRVFINRYGLPTYEAKDLALAPTKYHDFPYDKSIILTGNEINEYFKVVLKALSFIDKELSGRTIHISHGMVRLPEGKISSRKGNVITGEELLNTAVQRISEKHAYTSTDIGRIAEEVGIGAVKYALLKGSVGKDIEFSFDESLALEGNSGPYIQYSYVRTKSILEKAKKQGMISDYNAISLDIIHNDELELLRLLIKFPSAVESAGDQLAPHIICTYLYELSKKFNLFYQNQRILDAKDIQVLQLRIMLVDIVNTVLRKGLHLLGVAAPEKM